MTAVRSLSRFEYDLVRIARCFVGDLPIEQILTTLLSPQTAPPCLTADCVRLVEDTLRKGLILFLVRAGGWHNQRFLRSDRPTLGRVWERIPLDERALTFSSNPLRFLLWLTAEKPGDTTNTLKFPDPMEPGDELFFALALEKLRGEPNAYGAARQHPGFVKNPFAWLMNANHFAVKEVLTPPSFDPLFTGVRAAMLECVQPWLTEQWTRSERSKRHLVDWVFMSYQGRVELSMWPSFLTAAETTGRPDLARFALRSLAKLLRGTQPNANEWL